MAIQSRRAGRLAAACGLAILALVSAAEAGPRDPDSPNSSVDSSSSKSTAPRLALFGFGESKPKRQPAPPKQELYCPRVMVQPGTAAHIVYERGREGEPAAVKYQVRFSEFARECIDFGAEAGIRIGIAARALVGPVGQPGAALDVPIRFVVLDSDRKVVVSQVTRLRIQIPAGANGITFTHVEELGVPMPANRLKGWDFRVGFETRPSGAQG